MNVNQRDVILLPVPFSDQTIRKMRPAIVVSNDHINSTTDDIMFVPLTSLLKDAPYSILITDNDLIGGRLAAPSRVRADKIFTAHKSLIARKIGVIKHQVLASIKQEINKAL